MHQMSVTGLKPGESLLNGWMDRRIDGWGRGLVGLRSFSTALHDRTEHEGRVMEGVEGVIEGPCSGARRSLLTCWITSLRCEGKRLTECVKNIKDWMTNNFLLLNSDKTERDITYWT